MILLSIYRRSLQVGLTNYRIHWIIYAISNRHAILSAKRYGNQGSLIAPELLQTVDMNTNESQSISDRFH